MGKIVTDKFDFASLPEEGWPVLGSYIVAFDTVDNLLKKMDSNGVLTILEGGRVDITQDYANDAAASGGGIAIGHLYHTSGVVKVRLT